MQGCKIFVKLKYNLAHFCEQCSESLRCSNLLTKFSLECTMSSRVNKAISHLCEQCNELTHLVSTSTLLTKIRLGYKMFVYVKYISD
jgi:hypothetical protein